MIIDVHTHTFPDKIADSAIAHMEEEIVRGQGFVVKAERRATFDALVESTKEAGIDISLICPVATNTSQPDKINRLAPGINEKFLENKVWALGAVHPDCEDYKRIIDEIVAMDLRGIKLHPDYQNTYIEDEKYLKVIDYAANKNLAIIVHAGEDVGLPDTIHCSVDGILGLWKHIQPEKLILAHLGGWRAWDEVEDKLAGLPLYYDTAVVLQKKFPVTLKDEDFVRLVRKIGCDRVLFGTDSPWYDQKQALDDLQNCGLNDEELKMVLGENSRKIFRF